MSQLYFQIKNTNLEAIPHRCIQPVKYMRDDDAGNPLDSKLTWPYLVQDIADEIWGNKTSLIVVVVITLISIITVSILPFSERFWEYPYAVEILVFLGLFTIIPVMIFYIIIFLRVRKKISRRES